MRVELLGDTGSSVSIVKSALVAPEQYTMKQTTCLLCQEVSASSGRGRYRILQWQLV